MFLRGVIRGGLSCRSFAALKRNTVSSCNYSGAILDNRGYIRVSGVDTKKLLQGLCTIDVNRYAYGEDMIINGRFFKMQLSHFCCATL